MAKITIKHNERTQQILEELDQFREFCVEYGYRWNEADLYNFRSYSYQQFHKALQGKAAKNMWDEDLRRLAAAKV